MERTSDNALRRTTLVVLPVQEDLKRGEAETKDTGGDFGGSVKNLGQRCVTTGEWENLPPEKNRRLSKCYIATCAVSQAYQETDHTKYWSAVRY